MAKLLFPLLSAVAAGLILYSQLFGPDFVGLANNGDFPRLAGRLSLCPDQGWAQNRFTFFVPFYHQANECHWDSRVPTCSVILAHISQLWQSETYDIRGLAGLYSLFLLALIAGYPPFLLFSDLGNTAYFNSFFLEPGALLGLLGTFVFARALVKHADRPIAVVGFTLSALILITSKVQHAWLAIPLAIFLIFRVRRFATAPAILFLPAAGWMILTTPADFKAANLWNSIFADLLPETNQVEGALRELGLPPEYKQFIGQNAFSFPDQVTAEFWTRNVYAQSGFKKVGLFYVRHPQQALGRIAKSASLLTHIRPDYVGNFQRSSTHAAGQQSHRVSPWSDAKAWLYSRYPLIAIVLYAMLGSVLWRSPYRPLAMLILAMALMEFTASTFADYLEDYRHHALLHQLSDVWVCFAGAAIVAQLRGRKHRGSKPVPVPAPA